MSQFNDKMAEMQVQWRKKKKLHLGKNGSQNGKVRDWILPWENRFDNFFQPIRQRLQRYIQEENITAHTGIHNLKSSWVQCANLYFPFGENESTRAIVGGFLKQKLSSEIELVEALYLEYLDDDTSLSPSILLGESDGKRGSGQTSPDLAFSVKLKNGQQGLILVENKLVEHSFYGCSGRNSDVQNKDIKRCLNFATLYQNLQRDCHQLTWKNETRNNRRYWEHLKISDIGLQTFKYCPAAVAGYQLFRQQALAEAIASSGRYDTVFTCVAYDERNSTLIHCLKTTGVNNFTTDWGGLFNGRALFASWTHQEWVDWVAKNGGEDWSDWLGYIKGRYDY